MAFVRVMDIAPEDGKKELKDGFGSAMTVLVLRAGRGTYDGELIRIWAGTPGSCALLAPAGWLGKRFIMIAFPDDLPSEGRMHLKLSDCSDGWLEVFDDGKLHQVTWDRQILAMTVDEFFKQHFQGGR